MTSDDQIAEMQREIDRLKQVIVIKDMLIEQLKKSQVVDDGR